MTKTEYNGMHKIQEGVVLQKDAEALALYKKNKMKARIFDNYVSDIETIKNDLAQIKELLGKLVN